MDLPSLDETKEHATQAAQSVLWWLDGGMVCDTCGTACEATQRFVAEQAIYTAVWECPNCDALYYREEGERRQLAEMYGRE